MSIVSVYSGPFGILSRVSRKKKKKIDERPIFDSIRKPTAPPSRKFGGDVPEEKLRPSLRKLKHRKLPEIDDE